jgi:hypothetical protein
MFASARSSPAFSIGGLTYDPVTETMAVPLSGWVCFHCGERCLTVHDARLHFGDDPGAKPACIIKGHFDGDLMKALRQLEAESIEEIARLQQELEQAEQDFFAERCKRERAVRDAEEQGYEKGLTDGRAEGVQDGPRN